MRGYKQPNLIKPFLAAETWVSIDFNCKKKKKKSVVLPLLAAAAEGFWAMLYENKRENITSRKKSRASEQGICLSALLGTV